MRQELKPLLLFLFLFALIGYLREFFFVHLNIILYATYYKQAPSTPVTGIMEVFTHFSYSQLYYSKYAFTLLFTGLYFIVNQLALKKIANSSFLNKVLLYAYALMLGMAALSLTYGYFVNSRLQDDEYTLSRWLMGIAQSPIICLILLASETLYKKSNSS